MAHIKIDRKITKYRVQKPEAESEAPAAATEAPKAPDNVIWMHEKLERPEVLIGSTYKIKTPVSDHAMYVTINDILLNEGTPHEQRRPFEVFINSKNLDHFQWIVALTRVISAVFRKGGDTTFLVDELKAVFDPKGGYWQPGGKFMPSTIAELGYVIERHLQSIGLLKKPELDVHQRKLVETLLCWARGKDGSQQRGFIRIAEECNLCEPQLRSKPARNLRKGQCSFHQ